MVSQFGLQGYTITGKTADLTVVQKTIIDPPHNGNFIYIALFTTTRVDQCALQ